jgi:ectoine hydroxylase-related dioxygenase (phytanoyl-CoA dioxygenase family)
MTGHFPLDIRLSPELWRVPKLATVKHLLKDILGAQLYMHLPPTARFVLPGNNRAAVPPHRDISYNAHMRNFVTFWVPLVDIDDLCGGVTVYEGSQREVVQAESTENFWLKGVPTDGYEPVHCKMRVGDALLMSHTMLHGSVANRSDHIRCSIDYRFFGGPHRSSKHVLDLRSWLVCEPYVEP